MILEWIRRRLLPAANLRLLEAFPSSLRAEALTAVAALPKPSHASIGSFSVRVGGESVSIPYRMYFDVSRIHSKRLPLASKHLLDAILTRDWDGFVRQNHLKEIVALNQPWVVPFVVQLVGEYVVEIIQEIESSLDKLDRAVYAGFLQENAKFLHLTEQRVISYWDCYYRHLPKEQYAGFRVLRFLKDSVARKS